MKFKLINQYKLSIEDNIIIYYIIILSFEMFLSWDDFVYCFKNLIREFKIYHVIYSYVLFLYDRELNTTGIKHIPAGAFVQNKNLYYL